MRSSRACCRDGRFEARPGADSYGRGGERAESVGWRSSPAQLRGGAGKIRGCLGEVVSVLENFPESAFAQMVELRGSFIAPVPGVMVERIDRRSKWD